MPIRSRRGFAPRRTKRAAPAWGHVEIIETTIAASSKVLLGSFILSNPPLGETVLRVRVRISVITDQTAAREAQLGAFGMIVVTDLAVAAGAASIPGPSTDGADDGWFLHQAIVGQNPLVTFGGVHYDIDSKAMRKVEDGGAIAIMVENSAGAGVGGFKILTAVRLLAKLTES